MTDKKNRVFITKYAAGPEEVLRDIFIGQTKTHKDKSKFVVAFKLTEFQKAQLKRGEEFGSPLELIHNGTLRIAPGNLLYSGPNPW